MKLQNAPRPENSKLTVLLFLINFHWI